MGNNVANKISDKLRGVAKKLYKVYLGIGIFFMGLTAACVIYSVIARYFFGISHTWLEEFITTVFAYTTFWSIGICFIGREHIIIDSIYNIFPLPLKKIITIFNYAVVLIILSVMLYHGAAYASKFGEQLSFGMHIPMIYMYGIIPVGCFLGILCVIINMGIDITAMAHGELWGKKEDM
jgi:TRAP-type C4-dicarboxylate transport system permease small subunit